ncbi:ATP synthase subunit gamma [Flavobacterium cauense R2A-7]|uniref:ATP synthase gamma chain n=1 Tax=Flavobacterium cauense R2A-7 TaxID=1341154 RepID=V6SC32_9FLAO|nr:ATP synthase F1 subunit gamma [Flavobacterium cauense]ESU21975.1 ATP synthase subunit gamma [Flavobacterium cauense R2A-7]KGO81358.1 ATP F0F1 synthase subunit gamma [Flavobacterium cauense R2A-7]TWI13191.1 F-type H+-transporting ATPase subunit gamma [Flavobacterium cauense R2A-7]
MANLKEIRNRITSVSSTMQITSAMKMVSAAKLKKAQDAITAMRPYAEKLTELIQNLSASLEGDFAGKYTDQREVKKVLLVVVTSNRGLCGAFNANVLKQVKNLSETTYAGKQVGVFAIGKKAHDALVKTNYVVANRSDIFDDLTFDNAAHVAEALTHLFVDGEYDKIELVYNQFKNAATQIVVTEQFLPLAPIESKAVTTSDYIFEPSKEEIVLTLIPKSLKTQLYKAVRDSFAAEHGARMTAMHKATDNATELRNQLKLTYNKARQAAITNEILEIVGGAEALNN